MPIGPIPPGCIAVCAPAASDVSQDVPLIGGVVQLSTDGVSLSRVQVTSCDITAVTFVEASPRAIGVNVAVAVNFTFVGTADGFTFVGAATVQGSIVFVQVLLPTHGSTLVSPPDCAGSFTCAARYAGVDPTSALQQFTVHLTGDVTCVACSPVPYVIVKGCLPTAPLEG